MKIDLGRVVGADGKSAYQIAVEHGFEGTEQEWIDSLNYDDDIYALDEKINQEITDRTNADSEIKDLITSTVDLAIANVVNGAPEDFDTLKEMSDWISEHSEDASAMNSAILENKNAIAKKADASHSHDDRYYTETEIDTKLNSPLPWKFNYLETGYSKDLQYRKIGEGYITYNDNMNWSFYSEIEMIHHNSSSVFERGTIFVNLRGQGSSINTNRVSVHSLSGGITNLSKTKINYKIDTTNKRIYLEILAYCYGNYTNILFRNSLTRNSDMLFFAANNFWTFAANGSYKQSATTMQAGVTSGYTEIPLSVVSIDKNGNDIVNTYATKTELSGKADISHTHDDRYYTESEIDTKLNEKLNKNAPAVSVALNPIKNTGTSYMNMWTKIASCKLGARYALTSLGLEITQSKTTNNANSFWKGHVHFYTQNELTSEPVYSFICTEKTGYLAEDCIKILIHKLTDTNGNAYLQCEMYLKSPNVAWVMGYYTVLSNQSWSLFTNQDYVSELPSADFVITPTFISKASHDKNGNDIVDTYATKTELSEKADVSHTHDELAATSLPSGTDLNSVNLMAYDCKEFYSVGGGTYSNAPSNYFTLRLIETENGGCVQLFCSHENSIVKLYSRAHLRVVDNYYWTEWSSLANIDEINTRLNTYAAKTELSGKADVSHTHSEYHTKTSHNVKDYGTPAGTTKYVEISASEHFAGVEVNIAYSGKWYFSNPGSEPLYLGYNGATYNNYGLTGWAWGSENKKLYLRFAGWRGVSVSCLGATANMVNINDWTTTAPSGITFQTGEYDIKAEIDNLASANAGMSVSAKNVMEATGSIDFNTNKAILQLPIYSAEAAYYPTEQGAMWIQEIKM